MMSNTETEPATVPEKAGRAGETHPRGVELCIWSDSMSAALVKGVKGGKWYSLSDKAFSIRTLEAAFRKVKSNDGAAGVDRVTIARFEERLETELPRLSMALMDGTYRPQAIKRVMIPKPGSHEKRPLGIPTVRDRVVQTALRAALEPIFEHEFLDGSYGFRPGRSCHQALGRVWRALKSGQVHVVDADLRKFFDTIPHELIMRGLKERVSDGKLLFLVNAFLKQGVMEFGVDEAWESELSEGTPQGSVISPLLANIALHGMDLMGAEQGHELVRYADDFVILCSTQEEAESALMDVKDWVQAAGLSLHPDKTRIVDYGSGESFEFLGYEFKDGKTDPRMRSVNNLRNKTRDLTPQCGGKLSDIIATLNSVLQGWYRYFRYGYGWKFERMDGFIRRRLRSILARRKLMGRFNLARHHIAWPNAYFERLGLFSMERAHAERLTL
jgi:RNA-directed DNA polymerase